MIDVSKGSDDPMFLIASSEYFHTRVLNMNRFDREKKSIIRMLFINISAMSYMDHQYHKSVIFYITKNAIITYAISPLVF